MPQASSKERVWGCTVGGSVSARPPSLPGKDKQLQGRPGGHGTEVVTAGPGWRGPAAWPFLGLHARKLQSERSCALRLVQGRGGHSFKLHGGPLRNTLRTLQSGFAGGVGVGSDSPALQVTPGLPIQRLSVCKDAFQLLHTQLDIHMWGHVGWSRCFCGGGFLLPVGPVEAEAPATAWGRTPPGVPARGQQDTDTNFQRTEFLVYEN